MLPVTTALAFEEPARTQAIELLMEERVRSAVSAVVPRGDERTEVVCFIGRDRRGKKRVLRVPVGEPLPVALGEAVLLLNKYGRGRPITLRSSEGVGLRPRDQTYLIEVEVAGNDTVELTLKRDGTLEIPEGSYLDVEQDDDGYDDDVDLAAGDEDDGAAAAAFAAEMVVAMEAAADEAMQAALDAGDPDEPDVVESDPEPAPAAPAPKRNARR